MRKKRQIQKRQTEGKGSYGRRMLACLLVLCLVLSTACSKGGSVSKDGSGSSSVTALTEVNVIPEDGVITKEQFETVAGQDMQVQFVGETEDGISYTWTYDASQIQNPEDQNLKIAFTMEGLDDVKNQAGHANDALKMTMNGKGLICVPSLSVTLPECWQSDTGLLVKEQDGNLARMSDVTIESQPETDDSENSSTAKKTTGDSGDSEKGDGKTDAAEGTTGTSADAVSPVPGKTVLTMSVTSLDGDCYVVGGITGNQNKGAEEANGENTGSGVAASGGSTSGQGNAGGSAGSSGGSSSNSGSASSGGNGGGSQDIKNEDVANDNSVLTCTISISCATILNNMESLADGKAEFVPSDGWILPETTVEFSEGDSVHDVLQAVCKANGIHMESTFTPAYNSAYVEGINQLYEFDCGELSGWMYKVNGWFPNYGCSKYTVADGDTICWVYTCDLGKDVGDNSMY